MFTVAIVGRPNVGKSTLFNRLTGEKAALVDDTPGLTRDRREGLAEIGDISFKIIDTAGLEETGGNNMEIFMMEQTETALGHADVIFMMIDGRIGVTPVDKYFSDWVRKMGKKTLLLVNKCESAKKSPGLSDAWSLGLGDPIALSAEHGQGIEDILEALENLGYDGEEIAEDKEREEVLQIAIAGRPNVGKSTLFNRLLRENRSIISSIAGTTRDSVYVDYSFKGQKIKLVDTAGLRKKSKRNKECAEKLSVDDSLKALQYANVVILLLDATIALDNQDLKIAGHIIEEGRGLVIAVNKWDLITRKEALLDEIQHKLAHSLTQVRSVPVVTLSAEEGRNIGKVIKTALKVFATWNSRISTGQLNRWLDKTVEIHPPPLSGIRRIKLRYITQVKARPPTFALFSNSKTKDLPESYLRYMVNSLREKFGLFGVPIRLYLRKGNNPYDG